MKKQVSVYVNAQELARLKLVEENLEAGSSSNALRMLINRAYKKILAENIAIAKQEAAND